MGDSYIDLGETVGYGRFAAEQILHLVVGLDAELDGALKVMSARVMTETEHMASLLAKAGQMADMTYVEAEAKQGPLGASREILRKLVKYAESRDDGEAIAGDVLNGETLTTVIRRRPVKLAAALHHAQGALERHKGELPEFEAWAARLGQASQSLDALNAGVRQARASRQQMSPEIAAARERWLTVYAAAKKVVEGVLTLQGKTQLMPAVFDDLAEVHKVAGVTDEKAPPAPAGPAKPA